MLTRLGRESHWWVRGNAVLNATWHHHLDQPVGEVMGERRKQLVQMARYARTGQPDELLGWGAVDLREFRLLYDALADVVRDEHGSSMEDA